MLLYIHYKEKLTRWPLSEGLTSRVTSDIFDNDIYCEELKSEFKLTVLANQNIEFSFLKPLKQLTLASGKQNQAISGNFCSLNDCWLNLPASTFIFASDEAPLSLEQLPFLESHYRNDSDYRIRPQKNTPPLAASASQDELTQQADETVMPEALAVANLASASTKAEVTADFPSDPDVAEDESTMDISARLKRAKEAKRLNRGLRGKIRRRWQKIRESELYGELGKFKPYLMRIKQFLRRHLLLSILGFCLLVFLLIIFIIVKLTMTFSENSSFSAQSHSYERSIDQDKKVRDLLRTFPIINLNIFKEYDRYIISGLLMDGSKLNSIESQIKAQLNNLRMELNLVNFSEVQASISEIENTFALSCKLAKNFAAVKCIGTVSDKDSIKDQVLAKYQYNAVLPVQFELLYKTDIENALDAILADKTIYRNVKYQLAENQLTLSGYIDKVKLTGLNSALLAFLEKMPFIQIDNKLKIIEDEINLHIRQIIFNDYGNSLVDENGEIFNVGSKFKDFTITAISKNAITLQQSTNLIILYTPFNTDGLPEQSTGFSPSGLSSSNASHADFTQSISQTLDKVMIPPIVAATPLNAASVGKGVADVNERNRLLQELNKAKLNNTNPTLNHAYDDLIFNVNSDIVNQQKQLNAQQSQGKALKP